MGNRSNSAIERLNRSAKLPVVVIDQPKMMIERTRYFNNLLNGVFRQKIEWKVVLEHYKMIIYYNFKFDKIMIGSDCEEYFRGVVLPEFIKEHVLFAPNMISSVPSITALSSKNIKQLLYKDTNHSLFKQTYAMAIEQLRCAREYLMIENPIMAMTCLLDGIDKANNLSFNSRQEKLIYLINCYQHLIQIYCCDEMEDIYRALKSETKLLQFVCELQDINHKIAINYVFRTLQIGSRISAKIELKTNKKWSFNVEKNCLLYNVDREREESDSITIEIYGAPIIITIIFNSKHNEKARSKRNAIVPVIKRKKCKNCYKLLLSQKKFIKTKVSNNKKCSQCKSPNILYCSRKCQKINWPIHKQFCAK